MGPADKRAFFAGSGYLPLGRVATPAETRTLRFEAARFLDTAPDDHRMHADGHVRVGLHLCHLSTAFHRRAARPAPAVVTSIFGEPARVLTSLLFNKPPHVGHALDLHQDLPYYPYLGDEDLITCWLALDDTDETNGCVEYVPGSHRERVPHRQTGSQQALDIDPATVDLSKLTAVRLGAGEAVVHHGLTIHRSGANRTDRSRVGLSTLYVRASARITADDFPYPPIECRHG